MHVNVRNNRKSLVELPNGVRLLPGENPVAQDKWDACVALTKGDRPNRGMASLLAGDPPVLQVLSGAAKPLRTTATPEDRAKAHGRRVDELQDFEPTQIKDIVAATDDVDLLEVWRGRDERKEVRGLIGKRIRALKKSSK